MTTQESREQEIKRLNAEKVKQIALCHFYSYYAVSYTHLTLPTT